MPLLPQERDTLQAWIDGGMPRDDVSLDNAPSVLARLLDSYDEAWGLVDELLEGERDPEQVALPGMEPTPAMGTGDARVEQCARCGLVAYVTRDGTDLGECPQCGWSQWWHTTIPVGPFREEARA